MISSVSKISRVSYFFAKEWHLLYFTKDKRLVFNDENVILNNSLVVGGNLLSSQVYVVNTLTERLFFSTSNNLLYKKEVSFGICYQINDGNIYLTFLEDKKYAIVDLFSDQLLIKFNYTFDGRYPSIFHDMYLYFQDSSSIKCLSIKDNVYFWNISLSNFGEVWLLLGVFDKHLWVICTKMGDDSWQHFSLLALDTATGQIVTIYQNDPRFWGYTAQLNPRTKTIISLRALHQHPQIGYTEFIEISTESGLCIRERTLEHLRHAGLGICEFTLHDELIYFTAYDDEPIFARAIGVLDYHSLDLLWWEPVAQNGAFFGAGQKPVIDGDRLYILDSGGTLHIYQQDEAIHTN